MEHENELPEFEGMPSIGDLARWRAIIEAHDGPSDMELCGLKADSHGKLLGIWRAKAGAFDA